MDINYPIKDRKIQNFEDMEKIWHSCFYDELKIDPNEYGVLLTESYEYSNED